MQEQNVRRDAAVPLAFRLLILEDSITDAELEQLTLRRAGLTFTAQVVATETDFLAAMPISGPTSSSSIIGYLDLVASRRHG
jgi:hypothetical protein